MREHDENNANEAVDDLIDVEADGEAGDKLLIPDTFQVTRYREVSRRQTLRAIIVLVAVIDLCLIALFLMGPALTAEQLAILASMAAAANSAMLFAIRWLFRH